MLKFFLLSILVSIASSSEPLPYQIVKSGAQLGVVEDSVNPVFETIIEHKDATWIRLFFGKETNAPLIKITSLLDGAVQHLNPKTLSQWQFSSAYFNGDAVLVEVADEVGSFDKVKVVIDHFQAGVETPQAKSICNPQDGRELSSFKKSGRYLGSGGCTGWLINDKNRCFLTAHHCGTDSTGGGVMEFEVPLSEATPLGHKIVHPPPEHQYSVDPSSLIRARSPVGIGNDWQYFGCFPNSETGLTPFQRQGDSYILATNFTVPQEGDEIKVIGYGVVEYDKPKEWNQAQKVSFGPYAYDRKESSRWSIHYTVDTTGGDSGSAVEMNGIAIGVHTHGGCSRVFGGVNSGTYLGYPDLQDALRNPKGVCA